MLFQFGNFNVSESEVFYESSYSIGLVNLKPIVPYVMNYTSCHLESDFMTHVIYVYYRGRKSLSIKQKYNVVM